MKRFIVVEQFDIVEKTIVEANSKEEAEKIIFGDEEKTGDIIDCYETQAPMPIPKDKQFIGVFKVYNGEATYTIPVKTEAKNKEQATEYFNDYKCDNNVEIWRLLDIQEVTDDFGALWRCI